MRTLLLAAALLIALALGLAPPAAGGEAGVDERALLAVRTQERIKKQYGDLIQAMLAVAKELEQTDPTTANAIQTAAEKAQEALIAEDMDKVVSLLQGGLLAPADATQAKVIDNLKMVLSTLRGAGELTQKLLELERIQGQIEELRKLLARQVALERRSFAVANGTAVDQDITAAAALIAGVEKAQRAAMQAVRALAPDGPATRLSEAEQPIAEFRRLVEALVRQIAAQYPSPDDIADAIARAKAVAGEAQRLRVAIRTLFADAEVAKALAGGPGAAAGERAAAASAKLLAELEQLGKALAGDDLKEGRVAAQEALQLVDDIAKARVEAMGALPAARSALAAVESQQAVSAEVAKAAAKVDRIAGEIDRARRPPGEPAKDPALPRRQGAKVLTDAQRAAAQSAQTLAAAAGASGAVAALARLDRTTAAAEQERVMQSCAQWRDQLAGARRWLADLRSDPHWEEQQAEQDAVRGGIADVAKGVREGQVVTADFANSLRAKLGGAAEAATAAASRLGGRDAAGANVEQRKVIAVIEEVLAELESSFQGVFPGALEEMGDQAIAALERALSTQKKVNHDTKEVWTRRQGDGSFRRSDLMAIAATGRLQDAVGEEMAAFLTTFEIASRIGKGFKVSPIIPIALKMILRNVGKAAQRLGARDPGSETQAVQQQIETELKALLDAMLGGGEESMQPPPQWADNGWAMIQMGRKSDVVQMLILLQTQIIARTQEAREGLKPGTPPTPEQQKALREIAQLQADALPMIHGLFTTGLGGGSLEKPVGWGTRSR